MNLKYLFAPAFSAVILAASAAATAQTSGGSEPPKLQCAIGYVTGVGGSSASVHEYLATRSRDQYRYIADNPIHCKVSDEGRASDCTGITTLSREKVSVYDDSDSTTIAVVARVELEHGDTYPVIIAVPRQDVKCAE
jgi:hypothetical protein